MPRTTLAAARLGITELLLRATLVSTYLRDDRRSFLQQATVNSRWPAAKDVAQSRTVRA